MLAIEHVSYYIPEKKIAIETPLLNLNFSKSEIKVFEKIYQLKQVPKAEENLSFLSFMSKPVLQLLQDTGVDKNCIYYLIHTHTGRVIAPFGQSLVRELKYHCSFSGAHAFSVTLNNCASVITALTIAEQLLNAHPCAHARAIIVTADLSFTPVLQVIPHVSVMGDAASAVLLNRLAKTHCFLAQVSHTHGRYAAGQWMDKNSSLEFEEAYVPMIVEVILAVLGKLSLNLTQIQLILPHNVNVISWEKIRTHLKISKEKIYTKNIARYGHCFGADIFINYADALQEGLLKPGDFYMLVTAGLGMTVSAAVFKY